uniref:axonemal dynein light chain domain-containing protein 1-like isoform X1 n=1 Tax=Ciona intestinalis TaxID=7719 RepID=UPI000180D012|nr:axonemal dynein light chain domain-containing protein 1-like isoform X1 [Ciona intestinalis]|eukprot:XP_009862323.2 axonemal dynein light chain domain-containing protein 1-like isoform X1 [Ciona intestinalis]
MSTELAHIAEDNSVAVNNENTPPAERDITMQTCDVGQDKSTGEPTVQNEMIPEELLFALTQTTGEPSNKTTKNLSPIKAVKTPEKLRLALKKGPPQNVWHHKGRRVQFKHLTDNPRSLGKGVGTRDISFLFDVSGQKKPQPPNPNKNDKSAVRFEAANSTQDINSNTALAVPDSIIPEEYHVIKSRAVLGLEYIDEELTTKLTDHDQLLRIFPSLNPTKRFEVLQLLRTMDAMLEQSGIDDEAVEVKGPTQIHNLLELIKKEQTIYDLVFSEVIRQVSVECIERGQLLSKLRNKYADLLNRIPRQMKSLHAEVMAQRSLDRRLTEELLRFKSSISFLTTELQNVREHDEQVTQDANKAEADLAQALKESQTNASLVDEYHDLYELQRHRLEANVSTLTEERDMWSNVAYSLSLKIMTINHLSTAKRLHVSEKAWSKLAGHFSVLLSDQDSENLSQMQKHVQQWRDLMFHFSQSLEGADKRSVVSLEKVKEGIETWMEKFESILMSSSSDVRFMKIPPNEFVEKLSDAMKEWEEKLGEDSERFAGGQLLNNKEQLSKMNKESEAWTEVALHVYRRHKTDTGESFPLATTMIDLNEKFHNLVKQLEIRISGENGVAKGIIALQNNLDNWSNKLIMMSHGAQPLTDTEWMQLYDKLFEYSTLLTTTIQYVGKQQRDEDKLNGVPHTKIEMREMMKDVEDWMKKTMNRIEAEDGKLVAQASTIHTKLVHWMAQMLLHLAPNLDNRSANMPSEMSLQAFSTLEDLIKKAKEISEHISMFTEYVCQCCNAIVLNKMQEKKDVGDEDADHEYRDFTRFKREANEWIHTCEILLNSVLEEPTKLLSKEVVSRLVPSEEGKSTTEESPPKTQASSPITQPKKTNLKRIPTVQEKKEVKKEETKSPAVETMIKEEETVKVVEPEKNSQDKVEENESEPSLLPTRMEVIGSDENVGTSSLLEDIPLGESVSNILTPPSSSLTQSAYDAIAKMDEVQMQLLETEQRAQGAEEKVNDLNQELNEANERIRALEKKLQMMDMEKKESTEEKPGVSLPTVEEKKQEETLLQPKSSETAKRAPSRGSGSGQRKSKSSKKK